MIEFQGKMTGKGRRFGIVVSRFNEFITKELLAGARNTLVSHDVDEDDIHVAWVPGAWEIPATLKQMSDHGDFDGLIGLGCVIRGSTPHFDFVSNGVANGVSHLGVTLSRPVIFGVLTTDTIEQAIERAGTKAGNKGSEAALAAIEMSDLFHQLAER